MVLFLLLFQAGNTNDGGGDDYADDTHAQLLQQKESEIEAERRMREELTQRLQQLEGLVSAAQTAS